MKKRYIKMLTVVLSSTVLLGGCGGTKIYSASAADSSLISEDSASDTVVITDKSGESSSDTSETTSQKSGDSDSGEAEKNTQVIENSASESADESSSESELFSDRDLSGEYDTEGAVKVALNKTGIECSDEGVEVSGSNATITKAGTYILSGTLDNGSIIVDADKEDKVQLVLSGVTINSDTFAAIYVRQADKVFITLDEGTENILSNSGEFSQIDDNEVDAVIFSKDDITVNGKGTLKINCAAGNGISGKDEVTITGGVIEIEAAKNAIRAKDSLAIADGSFKLVSDSDGLHAENGDDDSLGNIYITGGEFNIQVADDAIHANSLLQIDGGTFDITAAEGLEGTYIKVNDGTILINASDDGVNAAYKSSAYTPTFEMNGGTLTINMGAGDTDAVDSNADLIINGGTLDITGQSAFDYDGTAQYNGGTITVNGQTVDSISGQGMGRGMGQGMGRGMGRGKNGSMIGGMDGNMTDGMDGRMAGGMNSGMTGGLDGGTTGDMQGSDI
jgi:hypothetical protein